MCASWLSALFVAALDIKLGMMGVLDADVNETLENFKGSEEDTVLAIKVSENAKHTKLVPIPGSGCCCLELNSQTDLRTV